MTIVPLTDAPAVPLDPTIPMETQSPVQLEHLARQFEEVFVTLLLQQMRQSLSGEGLFPGDRSDTLGGLFDQQMAAHISQHRGLGLAESLRSYLQQSASPSAL